MFNDASFWSAVWNTLKLFLIIPICLLLGVVLALIMDQKLKGTPLFRTLIALRPVLRGHGPDLAADVQRQRRHPGGILQAPGDR